MTDKAADRLLIVEDTPLWQRIFEREARKAGLTTVVVSTHEDASRAIEGAAFGVAWIDLSLDPDDDGNKDGFRVLQAIMEQPEPTISAVITGVGGAEDARDALKDFGADDVVEKLAAGRVSLKGRSLEALAREQQDEYQQRLSEVRPEGGLVFKARGALWEVEHLLISSLKPGGGAKGAKEVLDRVSAVVWPFVEDDRSAFFFADHASSTVEAEVYSRNLGKQVSIRLRPIGATLPSSSPDSDGMLIERTAAGISILIESAEAQP